MRRDAVILCRAACLIGLVIASPCPAAADGWDLSVFGGAAFPTYEQRYVVRAPSVPPLPGVVIQPRGDLTVNAAGGSVFGAALAREFGLVGLEARVDSTSIDLRSSGFEYTIAYGPIAGGGTLNGSLTVAGGTFETDRLTLLSLNGRIRTPGPLSLVLSGGLSYLPDFNVAGSTPVRLRIEGLPSLDTSTAFRLAVAPTESAHRFGVNGGAGLRVTLVPHVAVFAEARVFSFKEYELRVTPDDERLSALTAAIEPPRFRPVIINTAAGLTLSF